jgi:hypothetical protein
MLDLFDHTLLLLSSHFDEKLKIEVKDFEKWKFGLLNDIEQLTPFKKC